MMMTLVLIIDGEDFEDLDEIIARYINPMSNFVKEIMAHKNFKDISSNEEVQIIDKCNLNNFNQIIEKYLLEERAKISNRIPYLFTCCINFPGKFLLSYMIKLKVRNEYITITHEGFKFRLKMFKSFNELISWFKLHYNDPLPMNTLSQQGLQLNDTINRNQQQITSSMDSFSINDETRPFDKLPFLSNNFDHSRNIIEKSKKHEISRNPSFTEKSDKSYDLKMNNTSKNNYSSKTNKYYERNQSYYDSAENSYNNKQGV